MDKNKLIDKLIDNTGITREEAERSLTYNQWDILETMVYLEKQGRIERQNPSVFYTNEAHEEYNTAENNDSDKEFATEDFTKKRKFDGVFEAVCKFIDTGNNIFLQFKKNDKVLLKLPITVIVVLLFFTFWFTIPLMVIALFFDIELSLSASRIDKKNINKINKVLMELSRNIKMFKARIGKGV